MHDAVNAGPNVHVPVRQRVAALDVVRGFAVGGILLANVFVFFGTFFMPAERAAALPTAALDEIAASLERVFVEGKFTDPAQRLVAAPLPVRPDGMALAAPDRPHIAAAAPAPRAGRGRRLTGFAAAARHRLAPASRFG